MNWTLIIYVLGCVGPDCIIPDFEVREYATEAECSVALDAWQASNENHIAILNG